MPRYRCTKKDERKGGRGKTLKIKCKEKKKTFKKKKIRQWKRY